MLALPWRRFNVSFTGKEFTIGQHPIVLQEGLVTAAHSAESQTGATIWDGSIVLAKYLEKRFGEQGQEQLHGIKIIEVGCGTGLVGICAAVLGGDVMVTDLNEVLESTTQANIDLNAHLWQNSNSNNHCKCQALDWIHVAQTGKLPHAVVDHVYNASDDDSCCLIVMADVVWVHNLVEPLVRTIRILVDAIKQHRIEILIAHQFRARNLDNHFFAMLQSFGLEPYQVIPKQDFPSEFVWEPIGSIFRINMIRAQ